LSFPYELKATIVGFFTMNDSIPTDIVPKNALLNGPSILYSTARDLIMSLSSRTGFPSLLLPTIIPSEPLEMETEVVAKRIPKAKKPARTKAASKRSGRKQVID